MQNDDFIGLAHGLRDGFAVQRRDSAQVEDFEIDSLFAKNLRRFQSGVHHGRIGDDAEVAAFAGDAGLADRHNVVVRGNFVFNAAVEIFVLEEDEGLLSRMEALIRPLAS